MEAWRCHFLMTWFRSWFVPLVFLRGNTGTCQLASVCPLLPSHTSTRARVGASMAILRVCRSAMDLRYSFSRFSFRESYLQTRNNTQRTFVWGGQRRDMGGEAEEWQTVLQQGAPHTWKKKRRRMHLLGMLGRGAMNTDIRLSISAEATPPHSTRRHANSPSTGGKKRGGTIAH